MVIDGGAPYLIMATCKRDERRQLKLGFCTLPVVEISLFRVQGVFPLSLSKNVQSVPNASGTRLGGWFGLEYVTFRRIEKA